MLKVIIVLVSNARHIVITGIYKYLLLLFNLYFFHPQQAAWLVMVLYVLGDPDFHFQRICAIDSSA